MARETSRKAFDRLLQSAADRQHQLAKRMPIHTVPAKIDFRRFGFGGLCLLVALIMFAVQEYQTMVGQPQSWIGGTLWLSAIVALAVFGIWLWDRTATTHWVLRLLLSLLVCLLAISTGYGPIRRQYVVEHSKTVPSTTSTGNNTDTKLNEILGLITNQNEQQQFLAQYPLGYTIFDVDYISGAYTPYQVRQGLEEYEFNFRPVQIIENTPTRISIRLPEVVKNGKPLFTNATIGGDKESMKHFGAGNGFSNGTNQVLGT